MPGRGRVLLSVQEGKFDVSALKGQPVHLKPLHPIIIRLLLIPVKLNRLTVLRLYRHLGFRLIVFQGLRALIIAFVRELPAERTEHAP